MVEVNKNGYKEKLSTLLFNLMKNSISLIWASITFCVSSYPMRNKRVSPNYNQIMIMRVSFNKKIYLLYIAQYSNQIFCHECQKSSENVEVTVIND